jgi:acyclic terpene utilization AtuA family protein
MPDPNPREVRIVAPTSILGAGFKAESLATAMSWRPDVMACDAGSTDPGPYFLGTGDTYFSQDAMRSDLERMLLAARGAGIPLLIGSAGGSGLDSQVILVADLVAELARRHGLRFRLGLVRCEPSREYLKALFRAGRIRPLTPAPELDVGVLDRSAHIVAMTGTEPLQAALDAGADVVVSGRCSDAALFATVPVASGFGLGPSWHAAKILECAAACVVNRRHADPIFAWVRDDHFVVEPPNPEYRCSPVSVASHTLYENGSPYELVEPSGTLLSDAATYTAESERSVRVSGSRFVPAARVTNKLEGAELVGYQTIIVGAVRDPVIIRQLDGWLESVEARIRARIRDVFGQDVEQGTTLTIRRYGIDGVMGVLEPTPVAGHEVCLVFELTAASQELANAMAKSAAHMAAHYAVPEYAGLITALALPYSPHEVPRGPVYRFTLNHVIEPDDPLDPFTIETIELR